MQPTEHKHPKDEELIAHIKHSLKAHEELYQLGAWEKFNEKQQTKKRPIFWVTALSGVAAVLAIGFAFFLFINKDSQKEQLAVIKPVKGVEQQKNSANDNENKALDQQATNHNQAMDSRNDKPLLANSAPGKLFQKTQAVIVQKDDLIAQNEIEPANNQVAVNVDKSGTVADLPVVVAPQVDQQIAAVGEEKSKPNILEFLADETKKNEAKQDKLAMNKKEKKWDLGLVLAPSFGNTKELNMGYGISMSYNFSKRFSLTSGIAYNKMNASKNLQTNVGMSSIIIGNTKSLELINEQITGVDIPLELKYHVNKNVYANLGISGFAVLNQSRNNTFVEEVVIKSASNTASSSSSAGGAVGASGSAGSLSSVDGPKGQFANSYIINQRTTERASSAALEDLNYIGFYNLSVGYTKKVYKNHSLSIEPFVKLPIKQITQDNLKMVGTGLRLKVGF
jgi:cell division protein FtsB